MTAAKMLIRVGHSPDPDDAFMFYALACGKLDTAGYRFEHELVDIETLNRRAQRGELELTAVSLHAYAYLADKYILCTCGASMGDNYGPIVVSRQASDRDALRRGTIAVPGTWTTAYLTLRLWMGNTFDHVVVPFDQILEVTRSGQFEGRRVDAGLVIHEGQLTYRDEHLEQVVDLGQWWMHETGLPLPLGANAIRKDLGARCMRDVHRYLLESIRYGLAHREDALQYALGFARGLDARQADQFVGMYVNDWTLDFGDRGRRAVATLLERGFQAGIIPHRQEPEFVS